MSREFHCPSCDKKLFTYEERTRKYGKLLKECKKCGAQYLDLRYYELAIDGIPEDEFKVTRYSLAILIGALFGWRGIYIARIYLYTGENLIKWLLPISFILISFIVVIVGLYEIFMIATGLKRKKLERLFDESKARMRDSSYIYTLKKHGYVINEEYDI